MRASRRVHAAGSSGRAGTLQCMLDRIIAETSLRLPDLAARGPEIMASAAAASPARDFVGALGAPGLSIISEFKRASPSRGLLNSSMDPATQAIAYESGGAAAMSILTEPTYFLGSAEDLIAARSAVSLPVIRKDFTLDPLHVWEARAMGADAILLIVAILDDATLATLLATAREAGLGALVEVHDSDEARRAVDVGAECVGVNNRDLTTFAVDLATAEVVAPIIEGVAVTVAESGIHGPADAARMKEAGFDALLVGEYLVRSGDPRGAIEGLGNA